MVGCSPTHSSTFDWLIDDGVSMEAIAFGCMADLACATLSVLAAFLRPAAARRA